MLDYIVGPQFVKQKKRAQGSTGVWNPFFIIYL